MTRPALRIARRCGDPFARAVQHRDAAGLHELGGLEIHDGHGGVVLGCQEATWPLELVWAPEPRHRASGCGDAMVLCEPARGAWQARVDALDRAASTACVPTIRTGRSMLRACRKPKVSAALSHDRCGRDEH
jgi:hypothetical protein